MSDVAITYAQSKERADEVVDQITAHGRRGLAVKADSAAADEVVAAVEQTVDEFGRLDILVNNAGIFPFGPIDEVSLEEIDRTLASTSVRCIWPVRPRCGTCPRAAASSASAAISLSACRFRASPSIR